MIERGGDGDESLERRIQEIESWRELWVDPKLKKIESTQEALVAFQRLVMAAAVTIAALFGFFADSIKKKIGLG